MDAQEIRDKFANHLQNRNLTDIGALILVGIEIAAQLSELNEQFLRYRQGLAAADGWVEIPER